MCLTSVTNDLKTLYSAVHEDLEPRLTDAVTIETFSRYYTVTVKAGGKKGKPKEWYIKLHGRSCYFNTSIHQFIEFKCCTKPCNNLLWSYN